MKTTLAHLVCVSLCLACTALALCSEDAPPPSSCENLGEGRSEKGAPIRGAAEQVFALMLKQDWRSLHALMSEEAQGALSEAGLRSQCTTLVQTFGRPVEIKLVEIHLGNFVAPPSGAMARSPADAPPSIALDGRSSVLPGHVKIVSTVPGRAAVVLGQYVPEEPKPPSWLTVLLQKSGERWQFVSLHVNPMTVNGHGAQHYIDRAIQFAARGKQRAAYLYRQVALSIAGPGPQVVLIDQVKQLQSLMADVPPNMPLPGKRAPEVWAVGQGMNLTVHYVYVAPSAHWMTLEVRYKTALSDPKSDEAECERRALVRYIARSFPEYVEAFDGIHVGTVAADGRGFRGYYDAFQADQSEQ